MHHCRQSTSIYTGMQLNFKHYFVRYIFASIDYYFTCSCEWVSVEWVCLFIIEAMQKYPRWTLASISRWFRSILLHTALDCISLFALFTTRTWKVSWYCPNCSSAYFFSLRIYLYTQWKIQKKKLLMNSLNWKFACMNICVTFDIDRALMVWKVVEGDNEKRGKAMQELVTYNPKQWVGLHLCVVSRK